ncbi:hypothetical protein AB0L57_13300 [Nocardia sp. NPDC052254]|uniref:hypothetical protein n=1 Tax=Nocardia sp. NPDC052254 TaxID=3155681 RepID=UPI003424B39E
MTDCVGACNLYNDELPPSGTGTWRGELLGTRSSDTPPTLTWSLRFSWPHDGSLDVHVEGIPANVPSWREMAGVAAECTEVGEPISAWVYDGCHFEFEYARIRILRQIGTWARFSVVLAECDWGFAVTLPSGETFETDQIHTTVDADFEGISVPSAESGELAEITDTAGFVRDAGAGFYRIVDPGTDQFPIVVD